MASREDADDPLDRGPRPTAASPPPSSRPRPPMLETTQRRPSRTSATPTPDQTRGHHRRHSSLTSPPPPPEDFNPPADFTPTDCALQGIQSPSTPTVIQPATSSPSQSLGSSARSADDTAVPPLSAGSRQSAPTAVETFLQRPQIRVIQRLSQESVHKSSHSSRSSSNDGSDSSEVLAARRDELMSQLLTGEHEADHIRRLSGESLTPTRRGSTPPPIDCPVEVNIISSTPSHSSPRLMGDALHQPPTEEFNRRPSIESSSADNGDDDGVHAWDSVWPAPNAQSVVNFPPQPPVVSRFPSAPVSPYVTPSFSPAVVQTTRRLSSSPPHSPMPRMFGESPVCAVDRSSSGSNQRVPQAPRPGPTASSQHSSRSDRSSSRSPTTSPRLAPSTSHTPPDSGNEGQLPAAPGSPGGGSRSRSRVAASGSPGPARPQTSPSLPPTTNNGRRSRGGERSCSFINQFPELAPPFISGKELSSTSHLPRRLSETAIIRRPDASLTLDSDLAMSAVHPSIVLPGQDTQGALSAAAAFRSPTAIRPNGPRRARSAQEALDTRARLSSGLAITVAASEEKNEAGDEASESLPQEQNSPAISSPPPPERISFDSPAYAAYENAIEDDADDEGPVELSKLEYGRSSHRACLLDDTPLPVPTEDPPTQHLPLPGGLVDEGDLLPRDVAPQIEADVTFDDDGLSTLERIFLLCRSEYSFHRAYAARVLGDLLGDVDPCESVEYVLPLVTGFSLDEDESVKEAFAADLHRILWYFFTVVANAEQPVNYEPPVVTQKDEDPENMPESVFQLDHVIKTPGSEMPRDKFEAMFATAAAAQSESVYGPQATETHQATDGGSTPEEDPDPVRPSEGASRTQSTDTAHSASHMTDTETTAPTSVSMAHLDDDDVPKRPILTNESDKLWHSEYEVVEAPAITVDFFRPMLGTLLLSHNPAVADPVRAGIVAIISRLRGHGPVTPETWGSMSESESEDRLQTFLSQTGPHSHVIRTFGSTVKDMIEQELLHGLVLGMGMLSTEVPESLFDNSVEVVGDDDEEYTIDRVRDEALFRQQMIHEAALGRALSLSLIGSVSEMYSPCEVETYGFVDEVIRGLDGDVNTRAEAAVAMAAVIKAAPDESIERLLPVFELYANDEDDQVRQAACVCLAPLCKRIPLDAARRHFAVQAMKTFMASGDNVRYAALEVLGEVIFTFDADPEGPPTELITIYCDDRESEGKDSDWDVVASYNFPGVCLTLGSTRWHELRGLFKRIIERGGERVFRTVAAFLHELAHILNPDQVAEDILPVYRLCLKQDDDVRERIFEHIDVLICRLPPALGWQSFLRLSDSWKEDQLGGWRAREQLALHIPSFLETFREHDEVALVLHMMRSALLDKFAAVRDAATYAIPKTYDIVQRSHCSASTFYEMLLELSHSPRYRQRLTFVRCLREFMRPPPNKRAFEEFFMPALMRLASDIIDVRLGLAQAIADLFILGAFYGDKTLPVPAMIQRIVNILVEDESSDVRDALKEVGADRWAQTDASVTAEDAFGSAARNTDDVEHLTNRVVDALTVDTLDAESRMAAPHNRAAIASPMISDNHSEAFTSSSSDPFEASFARAQASGRTSKRSSADEILAAAQRAVTLPEGLEGSPPLSPGLPISIPPPFGLTSSVENSPPRMNSASPL
ncbi:unnamed protein product [Cutaneotrichosporon oleaginosum]